MGRPMSLSSKKLQTKKAKLPDSLHPLDSLEICANMNKMD